MKTRLLGAAVLIALAVVFVPMFFSSNPPSTAGDQAITSLDIPPAPDRDLQTRTLNLDPNAPAGAASSQVSAGAPAQPAAAPPASQPPAAAPQPATGGPVIPGPNAPKSAGNGGLATVSIGSRRPRDVETDPAAGKKPTPTTVQQSGSSSASAVVPPPPARTKTEPAIPAAPAATASQPVAEAAHGNYSVNLSAYASAASAQNLVAKVRALGYPVSSRQVNQGGRALTAVSAGPFGSRAAAEAARLKISQSVVGVPARLVAGASSQVGDAPAPRATPAAAAASPAVAAAASPAAAVQPAAARAGGWAVQVAAVGNQADANALRDKLRGAGFDGFVDSANVGGKQIFRVRAGPQTQRDDALRLKTQIQSKLGLSGNVVSTH